MTNSDISSICQILLQHAGRGDTAAFADFYDRTSPAVFGLIRSIVTDARQAEDATHEVYLHVWRTAPRYDSAREDASALVMTVARREALERIRRAPPPAVIASDEIAGLVGRLSCAHLMSEESLEVLALIYFRGQTLPAVADLLGVSKATATSRLNEALSSLRPDSRTPRRWPKKPQFESADVSPRPGPQHNAGAISE